MTHKRSDEIATPKGEWATPTPLFQVIDAAYGPIEIDLAATEENSKCNLFFDKELDTFKQDWGACGIGFLNPDYSRGVIDRFMKKTFTETRKKGTRVVILIPLAGDTDWFDRYVMHGAAVTHLVHGRVGFVGYYKDGSQVKQKPSFASCVAVFDRSLEQFGGRPVWGETFYQTVRKVT